MKLILFVRELAEEYKGCHKGNGHVVCNCSGNVQQHKIRLAEHLGCHGGRGCGLIDERDCVFRRLYMGYNGIAYAAR